MSGAYIELTDANFKENVASGVTLVDFWAPWCGPCKMLGPVFEKVAGEYSGKLKFGKLNVDEHSEAAAELSVTAIPTLIFFKDGKPVDKISGFQNEAALKKLIDSQL